MQQCHCLMNLIKNYTLTAITGVVVRSIISSIWFKNATRTTKLTAKAGWAEVKQEEIENMLVITLRVQVKM